MSSWNGPLTYFFWILSTIDMKFGQILALLTTKINMFLTQCWRLEFSSRPFYDFNEMAIEQYLSIFSSSYLQFLILPYSHFLKNETLETWHNWLLSNWSRLLNWKGPGTYPNLTHSCSKDSWKILPLIMSINGPHFVTQ